MKKGPTISARPISGYASHFAGTITRPNRSGFTTPKPMRMTIRISELSLVNMADESVSAVMSETLTITSGADIVRMVFAGT